MSWFVASILLTAAATGLAWHLFGGSPSGAWRQDLERVKTFVGGQFEHSWDNATERERLATAMANDLAVGLELRDPEGHVLWSRGGSCRQPMSVPVQRGPQPLGRVEICFDRRRPSWNWLWPAMGAVIALWVASGRVARSLARPLADLARVARDLGAGKLQSRVQLGRHVPGEVGWVAQSINDMAERIERQINEQRELLAAVSHELRTPLTRLRLIAELAQTSPADPKLLKDLEREVTELDALVGQLLASARLDFSALTLKELDARDAALRVLERAGLPATLLSVDPGVTTVTADATLLGRALENLLDNAKKHAGGATGLRIGTREGFITFEVLDEGPGVPEDARSFQAFYRASTGQTGEKGLGLGLALVHRIAVAHGGLAYAESRPEGGSRVGLALPARS